MNLTAYNYSKFYRIWSLTISIVNVAGCTIAILMGSNAIWLFTVAVLFGVYIILIPKYSKGLPFGIGLPNLITIFRLLLTSCLFGFHFFLSPKELFIGFLIAICLDGVDGLIARKFNQASEVGGNLDMETDAFLVLAISWIHYNDGVVGWWILIPGGLRYLYVILFSWSKQEHELLPKKARASIAVIFFISLILIFIVPQGFAILVLQLSSLLIFISFALTMYLDLRSL